MNLVPTKLNIVATIMPIILAGTYQYPKPISRNSMRRCITPRRIKKPVIHIATNRAYDVATLVALAVLKVQNLFRT
jgi:hypothetical protein